MIGRRVAVVIRWPTASRAIPATSLPFASQHYASIRAFSALASHLEEVTIRKPGRPKKHVGTTSTSKRVARPKAAGETKAKKTASAKKPAAKKKPAKKPAAKKKKVVPKRKPKKELTEAQKLAKSTNDRNTKIRALKKLALSPPTILTANPRAAFLVEEAKGKKLDSSASVRDAFNVASKELNDRWRNLTPAETEHYNHLAHTRREDSLNEYKKWVQSQSPVDIAAANQARLSLRKLTKESKKKNSHSDWPAIADDRQPKRPPSAWILFHQARSSHPDFKHIAIKDRTKLTAEEWKAMTSAEKAKYQEQSQQLREQYQRDHQAIHGAGRTAAAA